MNILITGASGFLGAYLLQEFSDCSIFTLSRHAVSADTRHIIADLRAGIPALPDEKFDLVVHAAGSEDEADSALNLEGTRNLLHALSALSERPAALCYISSWQVYPPLEGADISEGYISYSSRLSLSAVGESKLAAERECMLWSEASGVPVAILRPGLMFGNGIHGYMERMFDMVINSRYIHVRDTEGRLSIVTALDVARAVRLTAGLNDIFNVSDGRGPSSLALAEAMSANAGAMKRMPALPQKWADMAWNLFKKIPLVKENLSPQVVKRRSEQRNLSPAHIIETTGISLFNTLEVIKRTDDSYPYSEQ